MRCAIILLILLAGCGDRSRDASRQAPVDPELRARQTAFLQKMITKHRIFTKYTTRGKHPTAWVGPAWYVANYEEKLSFSKVIYIYHYGPEDASGTVTFREPMNGKQIGTYSAFGLQID